jgi:hypothetical protein
MPQFRFGGISIFFRVLTIVSELAKFTSLSSSKLIIHKRRQAHQMNILTGIRNIFRKTQPILVAPAVPSDIDNYIIKHAKEIEAEARCFIDKYGSDFNSFFYRHDLDSFIRKEVLPVRNPKQNAFLDNSYWDIKHPFNFPGPFYAGESDTCGTGDIEAPGNVMYDENSMEFLYRQPQSFQEFLGVIDAAAVEVFDSYACDGNKFWTYARCKEWWQNRFDIISEMYKPKAKKINGKNARIFDVYLKTSAEDDLRKYCYFLDNGCYPASEMTNLPQLS